MSTAHPDEIAILDKTTVIQITNNIYYTINKIAIIDYIIDINELLAIPYKIIITGFNNIVHIIKHIDRLSEYTKQQIIGLYCTPEAFKLKQHLGKLLNNSIKIGLNTTHNSIEDFAKSFNINATIWHPSNIYPKLHIITQIWKQRDINRLEELQTALYKNAINPYVYKIHILVCEDDSLDLLHKIPHNLLHKIQFFSVSDRLTYKNAMEYMCTLPANDFAIILNTDIYLDETIRELWNCDFKNTCLALLRYDSSISYALNKSNAEFPKILGPINCSQDAWIFQVNDVIADKQRSQTWDGYNIELGQLGCDNTILSELRNNKWEIANPCFSIKIYHLHSSNIRTYNYKGRVSHGVYTFIEPSFII